MIDSKEPLKVGETWTGHKSMQSEYYVEVINNLRVRAGAGWAGQAEGACLRDRHACARVCGRQSIPRSTSARRFAVASTMITMMLHLLNAPFLHRRHSPTVLAACSARCCVRFRGRHVSQ